jgi:hypothetical protein
MLVAGKNSKPLTPANRRTARFKRLTAKDAKSAKDRKTGTADERE